jgi:outer membrane protein TolC
MKLLRKVMRRTGAVSLLAVGVFGVPGCSLDIGSRTGDDRICLDSAPAQPGSGYSQLAISEPTAPCETTVDELMAFSPDDVGEGENVNYRDVSLMEAVQLSLQHSSVLRDLGGTILKTPDGLATVQDPAIVYSDPRFGEEAALSQFDANLAVSAMLEENDRVFNNTFIGNNGLFQQDLGNFNLQLSKRAATGTQMAFRQITNYDQNNSLGNRFGPVSSSWDAILEAEVRQPLLQGNGLRFNRTAGPSQQAGVLNGVLLARVRTDQSLADFEVGIRELVSNVENAYWDLYYAYRDLDAKIAARDKALSSWRDAKNKGDLGEQSRSETLQAEEQYWRFQTEVVDALTGRVFDATRTNNGSLGGTFRASPGVRVAERRLRLAIGMPINDTELLRPAEEPPDVPIRFDWPTVAANSVALRPELRKQRWRVKQRELELLANKNFLLPRLDAVAMYRSRGFGEVLLSESDVPFRSSVGNLLDGDYQEWQMGVEFEVPLGYRRAHAAVRNSQLALAREQAILDEQKRTVLYGLSNAVSELRRAYEATQVQYNRLLAAQEQSDVITASYLHDKAPKDLVLEADRRLVDATIAYHRSRTEYAVALKNVHFEQGTLLEFYNIQLAEGAAARASDVAAARRTAQHMTALDYVCHDVTVGHSAHNAAQLPYGDVSSESVPLPSPVDPPQPEHVPAQDDAPPIDSPPIDETTLHDEDMVYGPVPLKQS